MYSGRNPGSRTVQGLTIKADFEKLCAAAEHERERHRRCTGQNWRTKTIQNLTCTIIITVCSSVAFLLATTAPSQPMKWEVVCLAFTAPLCTLVIVTRRFPERQSAHFHIAKRYAALAASCRVSVTKYEDKAIGDSEFQALLEQHVSEMAGLTRDAELA